MKPKDIRAKIVELSAKQKDAMAEENLTFANECQGQINAYNDLLDVAIEEQDVRAKAAAAIGANKKAGSFLDQVFGGSVERFAAEFSLGFRAEMTYPDTPKVIDTTLPVAERPVTAVLDTIAQSGTQGNVEFFRLTEMKNAAAQWKQGDGIKPESSRKWEPAVANLVWIAAHMPVTRTAVSDYAQIEGIIKNELMGDLKEARNREVMQGANSAGIVGILNTPGIQQYTKKAGDNIYDSIRRMVTLARITGRVIPQYVALSPVVAETMDLIKNDNGTYLRVNDGGRVWSLQIVEDEFMTVAEAEGTSDGALVYAGNAATFYTKESDNVAIGLVDKQFVENSYTLLAESRNALAVKKPQGFVYLPKAI